MQIDKNMGEGMSEEAKWYVVHTYSGYENKVKANIEKTIENRHLGEQILEVRVPMEEVVEARNGVKKTVQRKLFPGYVLLNMVMNDDTWYVVRNTRGRDHGCEREQTDRDDQRRSFWQRDPGRDRFRRSQKGQLTFRQLTVGGKIPAITTFFRRCPNGKESYRFY